MAELCKEAEAVPCARVTAERLEDQAGLGCEPQSASSTQALVVTIILEAPAIVPAGRWSYSRGRDSPNRPHLRANRWGYCSCPTRARGSCTGWKDSLGLNLIEIPGLRLLPKGPGP